MDKIKYWHIKDKKERQEDCQNGVKQNQNLKFQFRLIIKFKKYKIGHDLMYKK